MRKHLKKMAVLSLLIFVGSASAFNVVTEYYGCPDGGYTTFHGSVEEGEKQKAFAGDQFDFEFDFSNENTTGTNSSLALGNDVVGIQPQGDGYKDVYFQIFLTDASVGPASLDLDFTLGIGDQEFTLGTFEMELGPPWDDSFWGYEYHLTQEQIDIFETSSSGDITLTANFTDYNNLYTIKEVAMSVNTPEPGMIPLLGIGMIGLIGVGTARRRKAII